MQINEVRRLIRLVEESDIGELEVWKWWGRIRIRKNVPENGGIHVATSGTVPPPPVAVAPPAGAPTAEETPATPVDAGLTAVKSPMVGTFYRAPAPDAEPYVQNGDVVEAGQTVCIIEAMKLMNEIQAEVSGTIVKVLAENAQPVEFGQDLFLVKES